MLLYKLLFISPNKFTSIFHYICVQVEKMAYDMLHEWRQREKENATVDRLIEALERAQCKKLVKGVQARCQSYHFRVSAAS